MDGKTNGDVVLGVSLLDGAPPKQSLGLGVSVIKIHQDPNGDSPWQEGAIRPSPDGESWGKHGAGTRLPRE